MWHTQFLPPTLWATWPMPPMLNLLTWHTMHMAMGSLVQSAVLIRLILPMWHIQCQVPMLWAQWPMQLLLCQQAQQVQPTLPDRPILPILPMWHIQLLALTSPAQWPMPPMLNMPIWHTMPLAMASLDQLAVLTQPTLLILPMWLTQYQVQMLWAQWPTLPTLFQQDQPTQPIEPTLPMWHTQLLAPMSQAMWPMPPMLNMPILHTMCMATALLDKLVPPATSLLAIFRPQAMLPATIF